jgi:trehalose synthase
VSTAIELPDLREVTTGDRPPERFLSLLRPDAAAEFRETLAQGRRTFAGHAVWNVNSTAQGGGVAEMLYSLVPYARGGGVDARWVVIQGDGEFFRITKRLHNRLHGARGDGLPLGPAERDHYEAVMAVNAERLVERLRPGDLALLHDPQTAGLIPRLHGAGFAVVWRCHVGVLDSPPAVHEAWDFLRPYVALADRYVFSCEGFVWDGLDAARTAIIEPSIDPFSPKNCDLSESTVRALLRESGLQADTGSEGDATFPRSDGSTGRIAHRSEIAEEQRLTAGIPLVLQVSRWDRLKDPEGVMQGFVDGVSELCDAHLILAGPSVKDVADDPEGLEVYEAVLHRWQQLPAVARARIHLVTLQMDDVEENAAVVNALQRRCDVAVQKSLAEGFGLTVSEAMWKARPVVASRVGGIQDQIIDGVTGCLVEPRDLEGFGKAVCGLMLDHEAAVRMGHNAQERVREQFLGTRHLRDYLELLAPLVR